MACNSDKVDILSDTVWQRGLTCKLLIAPAAGQAHGQHDYGTCPQSQLTTGNGLKSRLQRLKRRAPGICPCSSFL